MPSLAAALALVICSLAGVPVRDCSPAATAWRPMVERLPADHWRMLDEVGFSGASTGHTKWNGDRITMTLPVEPHLPTVEHELGHVASHRLILGGQALIKAYQAKFWPRGKPIGHTTKYGRSDPDEDFAECYKQLLRGNTDCDRARLDWITRYTFGGNRPALVR
jgi:hypothetical protein